MTREELLRCCGATRWVDGMLAVGEFTSAEHLHASAEAIWWQLDETDWREAFTHHPKIGDVSQLRQKFASTATWSESEQAGVDDATEGVLAALVNGNELYEMQYGYIFIVCATGKSAAEMLALLQVRLHNPASVEIKIAAAEQRKITRLRLDKLLSEP